MNNELQIRDFIISLEEPFQLADLIVMYRNNGGTNDLAALKMVSTLLDENELFYQEIKLDEEGFPFKAYVTRKYIEKEKNSKYTR